MNPELKALLTQIEAAGGPTALTLIGNKRVWAITLNAIKTRDVRYWSFDELEWDSRADALLIHALKLEARVRGLVIHTKEMPADSKVFEGARHEAKYAPTGVEHDDLESIAHCKGWLTTVGYAP